jgi:hypothetical protein
MGFAFNTDLCSQYLCIATFRFGMERVTYTYILPGQNIFERDSVARSCEIYCRQLVNKLISWTFNLVLDY